MKILISMKAKKWSIKKAVEEAILDGKIKNERKVQSVFSRN